MTVKGWESESEPEKGGKRKENVVGDEGQVEEEEITHVTTEAWCGILLWRNGLARAEIGYKR